MLKKLEQLPAPLGALIEIGILFLPAIPAYLWMWPNLSGAWGDLVQSVVYLYILAGTLFIGLRRWNWDQLGVNGKGIGLALACAVCILGGRMLIILFVDWQVSPGAVTPLGLAWMVFYYTALVGLVEELLFRGLVYRLLEDWRSARWAIWGSSFGFLLWHVFGQGLLVGAATFVIGLVFALIRWRGGGILGLIVLHALWDLQGVLLVADSNAAVLNASQIAFKNPALVWIGFAVMLLPVVYLAWPRRRA